MGENNFIAIRDFMEKAIAVRDPGLVDKNEGFSKIFLIDFRMENTDFLKDLVDGTWVGIELLDAIFAAEKI